MKLLPWWGLRLYLVIITLWNMVALAWGWFGDLWPIGVILLIADVWMFIYSRRMAQREAIAQRMAALRERWPGWEWWNDKEDH